jgi:hypothetical protein
MKKLLTFTLLISMLLFAGCKKILDKSPTDFISPENYYETEEHLNFALNGVYKCTYSQFVYGGTLPARMHMMADEGYHDRVNETSGMKVHNFSANDAELESFYSIIWEGINRANELLANLHKPVMDETKRNIIKGEALFLRGNYYFLLVQNFGGVPLKLTPTTSSQETNFKKATVADVYSQILKDMEEAEGLVQGIRAIGYGGRVNKSAVRGILARVNLYMAGHPLNDKSRYSEASKWAKMVIDDAEAAHKLNSDYSRIFINYAEDKYDIDESIWEAEFWGTSASPTVAFGRIGSMIGIASTDPTIGGAYGFIKATRKAYTAFQEGDKRRDWNIASFGYSGTTRNFYARNPNYAQMYTRHAGKFRREYELVTPKVNYVTCQNFPILRFSDVLLMYAEAENEINGEPTQAAIDAVNLVRKRAWSTGIKSITIVNGGSGYTVAPTVSFIGGGGSGAVATATITNGRVSSIILANDEIMGTKMGSNYTSVPTIVFTGGNGSGASGTAEIYTESDALLSTDQISSQGDFLTAMQGERMREFTYEALRRPDLIRWGMFIPEMKQTLSQILSDVPTAFYTLSFRNVAERNLLFPFPSHDINLNKALVQNPGW